MSTKGQVFLGFVAAAVAILAIVLAQELGQSRLQTPLRPPLKTTLDPFEKAWEYNASDEEFERVVKQHPELVRAPVDLDDAFHMPMVAFCASTKRTNYVRILIANGADVEAVRKWLTKYNEEEALKLIQQITSEQE